MKNITSTDRAADERRLSLKRTVLRFGVPLALFASVAGAAPVSADSSSACPGLATATLAGANHQRVVIECASDVPPAVDQFLKCCHQ